MKPTKSSRLIWFPTGGHIGDAVMILSLFAEIIRHTPEVQITYLVRRNAPLITELAASYPNITVVTVPYGVVRALLVIARLFCYRSIVIVPPAWGTHPIVIKITASLLRLRGDLVVGFRDAGKWQPYKKVITYGRTKPYIDSLREVAACAGLVTEPEGSFPKLEIASSLPTNFPFINRPYIVVHPFPHMSTRKTIPLRRWKQILHRFQQTHPSLGLVITGAAVDFNSMEELSRDLVSENIFLAVSLPLPQVAGMIAHAELYVGVDTGPTHIAGVLHAPSVILAQQNEPLWLPTYNPNALLIWESANCTCRIPDVECEVWEDGNPYRRCVYDLSNDTIYATIDAQLADKTTPQ